MAIVAKHWHGCVYFCAECQKKFPGEIFDDACIGPEGVAATDGKPQKISRRIFAPGNVGNAGMQ